MRTYAYSADPLQTPQNAASDQGLHCLFSGISLQNTVKIKTSNPPPKSRYGLIYMARMDRSTREKRVKMASAGFRLLYMEEYRKKVYVHNIRFEIIKRIKKKSGVFANS